MNYVRYVHAAGAVVVATLWFVSAVAANAAVTIEAPDEAPAGSSISVHWTGHDGPYDRIAIVEAGKPDATAIYLSVFLNAGNPVRIRVPDVPGAYELRYYPRGVMTVLGRKGLAVRPVNATVKGPATAVAGSSMAVEWTGPNNGSEKIGIFSAGAPDKQVLSYVFLRSSPVQLLAPEQPGAYELRYLMMSGVSIAKTDLTVTAASSTLQAPSTAVAGDTISVAWTGPNHGHDRLGIVGAGASDKQQPLTYVWLKANPQPIRVPDQPGAYEIRYLMPGGTSLAKTELAVTATSAKVEGPGSAVAGTPISVSWTGPGHDHDRIGIFIATAPNTQPYAYTWLHKGALTMRAPDEPGAYELRYLTQAGTTLATTTLSVTATQASIEGPVTAQAATLCDVRWTGPANEYDHIVAAPKSAPDQLWETNAFVQKGKQLALRAPRNAGEYELRYLAGYSQRVLARAELHVTPGKLEPGRIDVSVAGQAWGPDGAGAVEVILDASGSMLRNLGGERRIDIAIGTLKELTSTVIPAGTAFALRVFGHEPGSCRTTLDMPLQPLDAAAAAKQVAALQAKQGARTPIAASLEAVAGDLRAAKGERLVILITDGEETCGGKPLAVIEKLRRAGVGVRVNIVGFAVEEARLASTFRLWAEAGGGAYFEARDAASLHRAVSQAARPAFEVLDARKTLVASASVGDAPVEVAPGNYTVKLKAGSGSGQTITVRSKETTAVRF